ncbi:CGNR zinc finger domain-containing protein [Amycolatopsis aidingensis]|uniref:CGNR zinc finger domain-containing protein n=1 Tax=Amycolatopsis aidingensis TaxID=2842453 RepID=UPI001C0C08C5|nr:CGNR zinc finger domain-containing protein [Amycolatopsis aidingensis]
MAPSSEYLSGRSARTAAQRAVELIVALLHERAAAAEVRAVLLRHGEREPIELSEPDLAQLRAAATELTRIFAAPDVDSAAAVLNELLAAWAHPPRLTTHGGAFAWHLHVDGADDAPHGEWLLTSSCLALAVLLAEWQRPPGGICAAASCGRPFLDLGSGDPRRYCGTRCATRARVAAHRARTTK